MNGDLLKLKQERNCSVSSAFAKGTQSNHKTQWRSFLLFCEFYDLQALPCSLDTICLYGQFLSRSFKSVDSIKSYIYGVKLLHLMLDLQFPHLETFYYKLFIKGLRRCNPHEIKAALPITPDILNKIYFCLDMSKSLDITIWCMLLFSFFLMCRKSNLVGSEHEKDRYLRRSDVQFSGKNLIIHFRWSKTIQFGERSLDIPLGLIPNSNLCPVSAYKMMCSVNSAPLDSPAFVYKHRDKLVPVSYGLYQSSLKRLIDKIGFCANNYSSHSCRRGGATWAFKAGVPVELIQLLGDWKSDA